MLIFIFCLTFFLSAKAFICLVQFIKVRFCLILLVMQVKDLEAQLEDKVKGQQLQTQKELEEQLEFGLKEERQQAEKEILQYLEKLKGKEHMCRNLFGLTLPFSSMHYSLIC